ncbi:MAG TPA: saccharopine dehydrogenase NADP-binding domain-containing protein [Gammaproteobacteria bacterium]|nr:saccharopine dehydrogenase NADP-binding domain-containing protein [Gammaproteobacteria bacterium]
MKPALIYGITGYTGELIAKELHHRGWNHITIAGRNKHKTQKIAKKYNLKWISFDIHNRQEITHHILPFKVILNCAGPFIETIHPLVDICIENSIDYLDITGESDVFLKLMRLSKKAKENHCTLLPGVGFDVVPSDCLAKHVHNLLPEATHLDIIILGVGSPSRGTINTALRNLTIPTLTRTNSKLQKNPKPILKTIDVNNKKVQCIAISWGDIVTAYHSTKIPNITVYFQKSPAMIKAMKLPLIIKRIVSSSVVRKIIHAAMCCHPGPDQTSLEKAETTLIAHAWNDTKEVKAKMTTPHGYTTTVQTALTCLELVMSTTVKPGFQTPSTAFPSLLEKLQYKVE